MNVHVVREYLNSEVSGGYACCDLHIGVDLDCTPIEQRAIVIHEILENYLPSLSHDKIEELEGLISGGLNQLTPQ